MATTKELARPIGRTGTLAVFTAPQTLHVAVKVLDTRECWGRIDYHVTPVGGSGETWVSAERVTLTEEDG